MGSLDPFRRRAAAKPAYRTSSRERREKVVRLLAIVLLGVAAFPLGLVWDRPTASGSTLAPPAADAETARFERCGSAARIDCVVDGDTFWYRAAKIRLADINAPEVSQPGCPREAELGRAATARLQDLLNQGPFTLAPGERDRDRYGRLLRVASRGGESLGVALVREGLAEQWQGRRGSWC